MNDISTFQQQTVNFFFLNQWINVNCMLSDRYVQFRPGATGPAAASVEGLIKTTIFLLRYHKFHDISFY